MRDFGLRVCIVLGAGTVVITETLGAFHALRRGPLIAAWLVVIACSVFRWKPRLQFPRFRPVEGAIAGAIAILVSLIAFTALLSPPNSADAMAYHMPRVIYWAQAGSVAFFPTPYFNQISLQPLTEYFYLHSYLLSGGDRFINIITCAAFVGAIVAVSCLAGAMGLGPRGQALAALFCATLPDGILQASGAKNECMLSFWLVCTLYWAMREDDKFTGLSLGLALATKATAYLFAPPLLLAVLLIRRAPPRPRMLAWVAGGILLVNGPQYIRNLELSGSPLGYDSAQGDGVLRWRNEHPGWKSTVSNLIRHTSEQLGDRSERWNQAVFHSALALHRTLGMNPDDPDTTWRDFTPPANANHEANANNRWHLLLLAIAAITVAIRRRGPWILYSAGLLSAFLLFCFYLKWQAYLTRLELPLFIVAAPLAAALLEMLRPSILTILVCLFLLSGTKLPLLQNWTRPLRGPDSLLISSRDGDYFRDMVQFHNRSSYLAAVDWVARSGCTRVAIDISRNQVEYPLQALLLERNRTIRFSHAGVENGSARYALPGPPACAVICPDCAELPSKVKLYSDLAAPRVFEHFLVFVK